MRSGPQRTRTRHANPRSTSTLHVRRLHPSPPNPAYEFRHPAQTSSMVSCARTRASSGHHERLAFPGPLATESTRRIGERPDSRRSSDQLGATARPHEAVGAAPPARPRSGAGGRTGRAFRLLEALDTVARVERGRSRRYHEKCTAPPIHARYNWSYRERNSPAACRPGAVLLDLRSTSANRLSHRDEHMRSLRSNQGSGGRNPAQEPTPAGQPDSAGERTAPTALAVEKRSLPRPAKPRLEATRCHHHTRSLRSISSSRMAVVRATVSLHEGKPT